MKQYSESTKAIVKAAKERAASLKAKGYTREDAAKALMTGTDLGCIDHLSYQFDGIHLKVRRRDGKDGISWDELQAVKNEAVGEDATCVELYPAQDRVVNEVNMRHLWVIDPDLVRGLR